MDFGESREREREDVFSKAVKAGKRTYFFDVKETKQGEKYLTITESKRKFNGDDGSFTYEKHKIFLYKEDFTSFKDILNEMTEYVLDQKGEEVISEKHQKDFKKEFATTSDFTNVDFDDI